MQMQDEYRALCEAAQALVTTAVTESAERWHFVDAEVRLLTREKAEILEDFDVDAALTALADRLRSDGVTTPRGEWYSPSALRVLWETGEDWPEGSRFKEASFRTHQEAGSPDSKGGKLLAALCRVARGDNVRRPSEADAEGWPEAVKIVRDAAKSNARWKVSANALRRAMGRKANVPDTDKDRLKTLDRMIAEDPDGVVKTISASKHSGTLADALSKSPTAATRWGAVAESARERHSDDFARKHGQGKGTITHRQSELRAFRGAMMDARRNLMAAAEHIKGLAPITEAEIKDVEDYIARIEREVSALRTIAGSDLDKELQDMLEEEERE